MYLVISLCHNYFSLIQNVLFHLKDVFCDLLFVTVFWLLLIISAVGSFLPCTWLHSSFTLMLEWPFCGYWTLFCVKYINYLLYFIQMYYLDPLFSSVNQEDWKKREPSSGMFWNVLVLSCPCFCIQSTDQFWWNSVWITCTKHCHPFENLFWLIL